MPEKKLKTKRRLRVYRDHLHVSQTEFDGPGFKQRTWYPLVIRWWPRERRAPGSRWNLGVIWRKSFDDQGKRRKLSKKDQAKYDQAKINFQAGNAVACDRSLPDVMRHGGHNVRLEAANVLAELSRKTYPRR